jgi:MFS family permease
MVVDLIFSFFSHRFNMEKAVKITPVLTFMGMLVYAVWPWIFPDSIYLGLVLGTVIFSASSGFAEVLISPVIAAIPSENPEREMSKLHSIYAWGVVGVIILSTLFLLAFGGENWQILTLCWMVVPTGAFLLYLGAELPVMETPEKVSGVIELMKNKGLWLCVAAIFLGGASECTMAQWSSGYLEQAVGLPKVWGDIFGAAMFALMLGLGRTLYSKYGRNISRVLFLGACGATLCYFTAVISGVPVIGLLACAFTGFFASMLWPGNLVVASERFKNGGVLVFALMAAGGDLGGSIGPQLVGALTDFVIASNGMSEFAQTLGMTLEQLGMRIGLLVGAVFALLGIVVGYLLLQAKKRENSK